MKLLKNFIKDLMSTEERLICYLINVFTEKDIKSRRQIAIDRQYTREFEKYTQANKNIKQLSPIAERKQDRKHSSVQHTYLNYYFEEVKDCTEETVLPVIKVDTEVSPNCRLKFIYTTDRSYESEIHKEFITHALVELDDKIISIPIAFFALGKFSPYYSYITNDVVPLKTLNEIRLKVFDVLEKENDTYSSTVLRNGFGRW